MRDAIKSILTADATLMATLTGGVHTATEVSRQNTPAAFDATTKELKPCALLRMETQNAIPPFVNSAQQFFALYVYQLTGYDSIDAAIKRAFVLLNLTPIASETTYEIRHVDDSPDVFDDALAASLRISRYQATRLR